MSMSSESDEQLRARARCEQLRADVEENLRQLRARARARCEQLRADVEENLRQFRERQLRARARCEQLRADVEENLRQQYFVHLSERLEAAKLEQLRAAERAAKRAAVKRPVGQDLCSFDLEEYSIPNCPTRLGLLYEVVDSGKAKLLTSGDFAGLLRDGHIDRYQRQNLQAAIEQDSAYPLCWRYWQ